MPTEVAAFTPNQLDGTARWLDSWNADLFWGVGDASIVQVANQLQFRTDPTTWMAGIDVTNPNGVIQAIFDWPSSTYFLGVLLLSSAPQSGTAYITVKVDDETAGLFEVSGEGVEIPVVAELSAGLHSISVIQRQDVVFTPPLSTIDLDPGDHLWFHSLTCYEI